MKTKNKNQFRQGDVLIERITEIPDDAKKQTNNVLAHGEATGHAHTVAEAHLYEPPPSPDSLSGSLKFMRLTKGSAVVHQEHAKITLKKGTYRVIRQRQYSPAAIRNVAD